MRRKPQRVRLLGLILGLTVGSLSLCKAQEDGGETFDRGQEVLQSIFIPYLQHAPFSLMLETEWTRPMSNGGTFALVNRRPIKRDSRGRIYQERWAMVPKGGKAVLRLNWIQIADPNERTLLECNGRTKVCAWEDLDDNFALRFDPSHLTSGPLPKGIGTRVHEDLGPTNFAGIPTHRYRDTTTLNSGVQGNDLPMVYVRDYRFSPELGFNITSAVDNPHFGKQLFTAAELTTTEPDPHLFEPPEGYNVEDHRKSASAKDTSPK